MTMRNLEPKFKLFMAKCMYYILQLGGDGKLNQREKKQKNEGRGRRKNEKGESNHAKRRN